MQPPSAVLSGLAAMVIAIRRYLWNDRLWRKGRHCAPAGNERGRQLGRPYFLLTGLRKEARKTGYKTLNPIILLFLRGSIDFDAVVEYFRASGRRNSLGKN